MQEIKVYIASGEAEKASPHDGHRRCAYVAIREVDERELVFWGTARLKDMTALFSLAINAALGELMPDDLNSGEWPTILIIVRNPNFWERIDQALQREIDKPKKIAANRDEWKETITVRALFELAPARQPQGSPEEVLLRRAENHLELRKNLALKDVPENHSGLWKDGIVEEGFGN
jgi:hypothetical protein